MLGIILVSHGNLGQELLKTTEFILGSVENCYTVSIDATVSPDTLINSIKKNLELADKGKGVLILTDMFGGTPSNISLSFLAQDKVEVLTGANLPMLIKAIQVRNNTSLNEAASLIAEYGRKSIHVAGEVLKRKNNN